MCVCSVCSVVAFILQGLVQQCTIILSTAACERYAVLFRKYVSRNAFGRGRAILEWLGLTPEVIDQCYGTPGLDEEAAVQKGLHKWRETRGDCCTWQVLVRAMLFAGIAQQHCTELVEELHQMMQGEVTFPLKYSCTQCQL